MPPATAASEDTSLSTPLNEKGSPTDWQIIPGERIGNTALGDDPENLLQRLGQPDASDAAMGKAWLVWNSQKRTHTLAVFTTYADSNMMRKAIRQIRVTSPRFETPEGLHTGSTLLQIKRYFPGGKSDATGPVLRYNVATQGISFELEGNGVNATCTAVLVYPPGGNPVAYLPIPQQRP